MLPPGKGGRHRRGRPELRSAYKTSPWVIDTTIRKVKIPPTSQLFTKGNTFAVVIATLWFYNAVPVEQQQTERAAKEKCRKDVAAFDPFTFLNAKCNSKPGPFVSGRRDTILISGRMEKRGGGWRRGRVR